MLHPTNSYRIALLCCGLLGGSQSPGFGDLPNGRVAFLSDRGSNFDIYCVNTDGRDLTRLTDDPAIDSGPTWAPDGRRIAFHSNRDGDLDIHVMQSDGSRILNLTRSRANDPGGPLGPRRPHRLYVGPRYGNAEIYIMNADGSLPIRLTHDPAPDAEPVWSPDNSRIAFSSSRDGNAEIYVMNANGDLPQNLSKHNAVDIHPAWAPNTVGMTTAIQLNDAPVNQWTAATRHANSGGGQGRRGCSGTVRRVSISSYSPLNNSLAKRK
jgi:dipeptidyl aminopeptidase/acylaminoacyl peptidase